MKPAINLYLATATGCNVRCWSCPAGRKEPEPGGIMSMEMFRRILNKSQAEALVLGVQLYHYNEPTLIPHMHLMVSECRSRGLPVVLSSNFVVWKNIPAIMAAEPDQFMISVSGWAQETYERSHKDGDIEAVKENMREAAKLRKPGTHLQLSWHRYRYNEHELPLMERYCQELGITFTPYATSIIPHDRAMKAWATNTPVEHEEEFIVPPLTAKKLCYDRRGWTCIVQDQIVAVNGQGRYMLCSNFANEANLLGNFFDVAIKDLLLARKVNPVCRACKAVGGHVYTLQGYTRSRWSPLVIAEQLYRRLKLPGRFPGLSKLAVEWTYKTSRPQSRKTW